MEKIKITSRKCAIASFIVGIVSLGIATLLSILSPDRWIVQFLLKKQELTYGSIFILSLIGIILGIIGIKSERKILAITGIIISIVVLVEIFPVVIFVFFYAP